MFKPFDRNPFNILQFDNWSQLQHLLSDKGKCFPVFSVHLGNPKTRSSAHYPRDTFPRHQWSAEDEILLMQATVIEPTIHETCCDEFIPGCRLFHINDDWASDTQPTLVCTDFPTYIDQRVFPWADEAEVALRYLRETTKTPPASVLNLFCGAGTIAMSLSRVWPWSSITCTDINPRALQYTRFNAALNGLGRVGTTPPIIYESDVFDNIHEKFDLIVGIPPIALQPPEEENVEYLHSAGGPFGTNVIRKLLQGCNHQLNPGGRLVFLSYGLGCRSESDEPQELVQTLREDLPQGSWNIIPLPDEKIWRVGDKKRFTNPMPVQYMISRLADPTYRANIFGSYERWEQWIENDLIKHRGFSHLHYVIVDYRKPTE